MVRTASQRSTTELSAFSSITIEILPKQSVVILVYLDFCLSGNKQEIHLQFSVVSFLKTNVFFELILLVKSLFHESTKECDDGEGFVGDQMIKDAVD